MKFQRKKGTGGRPTAYTPQLVKALCRVYVNTLSITDAARACGIGARTVYDWLKDSDDNPDGPKGSFRAQLEEAKSKAVDKAGEEMRKTNPSWYLAHARPKRFGNQKHRVEVQHEGEVELKYENHSIREQVDRILEKHEKSKANAADKGGK